jgi:hypothetical protein
MNGWAISPDLGLLLARLVDRHVYDLIVEFGSGASTELLARLRQRQRKAAILRNVAFEHELGFFDASKRLIEAAEVSDFVELVHSPLRDYATPDRERFSFYSCGDKLAELASMVPGRGRRILVFVDGPPGGTGPLARYPALPLVLDNFKGTGIDVLIDDYNRKDEAEVVERWKALLVRLDRQYSESRYRLEKGACLLSVSES